MSILEIVLGVAAALVLLTALGSLIGQWLKGVSKGYPRVGGDGDR